MGNRSRSIVSLTEVEARQRTERRIFYAFIMFCIADLACAVWVGYEIYGAMETWRLAHSIGWGVCTAVISLFLTIFLFSWIERRFVLDAR